VSEAKNCEEACWLAYLIKRLNYILSNCLGSGCLFSTVFPGFLVAVSQKPVSGTGQNSSKARDLILSNTSHCSYSPLIRPVQSVDKKTKTKS
jgi:hypothetical protein